MALTAAQMRFVRLDGKMNLKKRMEAIDTFSTESDVNVILVSIKAGGLGINLTAASRVYVMEPLFNPAAEIQAIERVHRLGQKRDVVIKHLIMKDSIEEKIVQLQEKKKNLAEFSIERDSLKKLDKKEAQQKKLEDLKDLLK